MRVGKLKFLRFMQRKFAQQAGCSPRLPDLFRPKVPSISGRSVRQLKEGFTSALERKSVAICGESAGDPHISDHAGGASSPISRVRGMTFESLLAAGVSAWSVARGEHAGLLPLETAVANIFRRC